MATKFTAKKVDSLKPKKDRYEVWELGRQGFGVRVYPSGARSWVYLYWFEGKKRRMTIGKYPELSLAEAHEEHAKAEKLKERGVDPGDEKVTANSDARNIPTLVTMINDYLNHATKKTVWKDRMFFEKDVIPKIGHKKAIDVTRRNVIEILDGIVKRGSPIQANRGLAAIRRLYNWGISRDIVQINPCVAIERPGVEKSRDRVLSEDEIKKLWCGLHDAKMSEAIKLVLKFQLVTLQRKGEVINLEWDEIDGNIWMIPASKTKNKLTHRVPLSDIALEILGDAQKLENRGRWVFPSIRGVKPMGETSINRALMRNMEMLGLVDITPHDLRRTGGTFLSLLGTPRFTLKKVLNHVDKDVTGIYDRYGYDDEKKHALDLWASKLKEIIEDKRPSDNIVQLNRAYPIHCVSDHDILHERENILWLSSKRLLTNY